MGRRGSGGTGSTKKSEGKGRTSEREEVRERRPGPSFVEEAASTRIGVCRKVKESTKKLDLPIRTPHE